MIRIPADTTDLSMVDVLPDVDRSRAFVDPMRGFVPMLAVWEAYSRVQDFEAAHAEIFTPPVVFFLAVYVANGYDPVFAAERVGQPFADASRHVRRQWARGILAHPTIREGLRLFHTAATAILAVSRERAREELEIIATANMADYVMADANGVPQVAFDMTDRRAMAAVAKLTTKTRVSPDGSSEIREIRFELHDKIAALRELQRLWSVEDEMLVPNQTSTGETVQPTYIVTPVPAGRFIAPPTKSHAEPGP